MSEKRVTVKEIAQYAKVSPSTASMVLNNKGEAFRIAPETEQRVLQAAKTLGYHPSPRARRHKDGGGSCWCLLCPQDFDRGPTARLYAGIQRYRDEHRLGYEIILLPYEPRALAEKGHMLTGEFLGGAILAGLAEEDVDFLQGRSFNIPMVLLNRSVNRFCAVTIDEYAAGQNALRHFARRGHRVFGMIAPNYHSKGLSLRMVGFGDEFRRQAPALPQSSLLPTVFGQNNSAGGQAAMNELLNGSSIPTALFLPDDNMVGGVARSLQQRGLAVGRDVEIITFGNNEINTLLDPAITSFDVPEDAMGYDCARVLHSLATGKNSGENISIYHEAKCIYRASCPQ